MAVQPIRLPERFYAPRVDDRGMEVRDVVPWEGATAYVTDGDRVGIQFADGRVTWLGAFEDELATGEALPAPDSLHEDFEGVDLEALVTGVREYMELHPVLKSIWRDDLAKLDRLRTAESGGEPVDQRVG
jgi:hypothetical protein